jgi:hypothetical protein
LSNDPKSLDERHTDAPWYDMNMKKPIAKTALLAGATGGVALSLVVAAVAGQPLDTVALVVTTAAGMVAGRVMWAVWPEPSILDAEHPREVRRRAFWNRKKSKYFWFTFAAFMALGIAIVIIDGGLNRGWQVAILFPVGYSMLMAWGVSEMSVARMRKSRQREPGSVQFLPGYWSRAVNAIGEERHYWIFACALLVCVWLYRFLGQGFLAACMVMPLAGGIIVGYFWTVLIHAKRMMKLCEAQEVRKPSKRILALAADPTTQVRAIRRYRRMNQLPLKEARRVIEACLATRSDRNVIADK